MVQYLPDAMGVCGTRSSTPIVFSIAQNVKLSGKVGRMSKAVGVQLKVKCYQLAG